ncbi:MAG: endopeptidase La [Planctomycetota bacterium]
MTDENGDKQDELFAEQMSEEDTNMEELHRVFVSSENGGEADTNGAKEELPSPKDYPERLPVLPQRGNVIFPGMVMPAHVEQEELIDMVEDVVVGDKMFLALTVRDGDDMTDSGNLYDVGTLCSIVQMIRMPDDTVRFLAQGLGRCRVEEFIREKGVIYADVQHLKTEITDDAETRALLKNLRTQFLDMIEMLPEADEDVEVIIDSIEKPGRLADVVCANLNVSNEEKQKVLETLNIKNRLEKVSNFLAREVEYLGVAQRIRSRARDEMDKGQREYYLRQQLKAIQEELGETDAQTSEVNELREQLDEKELPEEVEEAAEHELGRLDVINPASPEYNVVRNYLDWILELPWLESTDDNLDLEQAREVLENDHYGLDEIKERVLEFLAVRQLREDMRGSILCFLGPPGTGKTSIGKSIARAMNREYVRSSLGGVRDEAEIRGHRRTYVGAMPGQIILGLKKAHSNNPVFMLDEVDKLGSDFRGDPASALLEVLDPEQNENYIDHYLDLPFDLSKVMFICTANVPDTIPPALRDRMEILEFPGYTEEEKLQIAQQYLVPDQIEDHGLESKHIDIRDDAINRLISEYTREAGVRNLEREIASICRKVAKGVAMDELESRDVGKDDVEDMLGPPQYIPEVAERVDEPGVATGVAWTATGGTVIFVEASQTPGDGKLTLTGQLGDVMKESAQAALTFARAHTDELGLTPEMFTEHDFHIHVPAGAIPKDGPSAGVTMGMALISLCTDRKLRHDVAMTGEITLRGKVMPVGGIKEKAIAAKRAGIKTLILPEQNKKDLPDVPEYAKDVLEFQFVDKVDEIIPIALMDEGE